MAKSERGSRGGLSFWIWLPGEPRVHRRQHALRCGCVGESKQMEAFDWKHCHQPEGRCSYRHFSTLKNHAAVFRWLITLIEKTKEAHLWFDTMPICYAAIHTLMGIRGMHHVPCIASHTKVMWPALWLSPTTKERNLWEHYLLPSSPPGEGSAQVQQTRIWVTCTTQREKNHEKPMANVLIQDIYSYING